MKLPTLFESVLLAELNLGLPPLSFQRLTHEPSDWSYVLKVHCILECALTELIRKRFGEDFDRTSTFKTKVLRAFELPELGRDKSYRDFLLSLNGLRNRFAHRASYIVASIGKVVSEIHPQKRSALIQSLAVGIKLPDFLESDPKNIALRRELFLLQPRIIVHQSAAQALDMLSLVFFIQKGEDGVAYAENFAPRLQDLLHDPEVLKFSRSFDPPLNPDAGADSGGI